MLSQYAANDGETLHVAVKGQGPALIFLHGWTSNHREWLPTAQQLAASRTTYCWDARGHGLHFYRHNAPNVERMAGDLAELIRHFGITSAIVVGHSMGALNHLIRSRPREVSAIELMHGTDEVTSPQVLADRQAVASVEHHLAVEQPGADEEAAIRAWLHEVRRGLFRNPQAESARIAVRERIRRALGRIEGTDPAFAKFLHQRVQLGRLCSYVGSPSEPWHL